MKKINIKFKPIYFKIDLFFFLKNKLKMFSRTFIDLIYMYNKINNYASDTLANYSSLYKNTFHKNLYNVDECLCLTNIYKEFIEYYDNCYITYFNK